MTILDSIMHLIQHIPKILALQIPLNLHINPFQLLYVPDHSTRPVIDWRNALHQVVEAVLALDVNAVEHFVDGVDALVDVLDAGVEVGELALLRFYATGEDVLEHLLGFFNAAFCGSGLLMLGFLLTLLLLLLVLLTEILLEALLVWLLTGVGVRRRDDELVDFE